MFSFDISDTQKNMEDDLISIFATNIPAVASKKLFVNLHRKLSISVPRCSENLVGNVIFGKNYAQVWNRSIP